MADHRKYQRERANKASWKKNEIDASKDAEEDKPKFNKEAYDELMKYAEELKKNKKQ